MQNYFYRDKSGKEIGPLTLDALAKLRFAGVLDGDTPVRVADSAEWKPCREIIADTQASTPAATLPAASAPSRATTRGLSRANMAIVAAVVVVAAAGYWWLNRTPGKYKPENSGATQKIGTTASDTTANSRVEAQPFKGQSYRTQGGRSAITLISSEELEYRADDGTTLLCKYQQDERSVIIVFGTGTRRYFNRVPNGLTSSDGSGIIFLSPSALADPVLLAEVQRQGCIANLRWFQSAKEQWALENKKTSSDTVALDDLGVYAEGGIAPKCPAGGSYTLGTVGKPPLCSVPGHTIK